MGQLIQLVELEIWGIGSGKEHTNFSFQMSFNSSPEMWQHPKPCLSHKSYLYKVTLFMLFSFMWSLEKPEIIAPACSTPGFSRRLCAVPWIAHGFSPLYVKTSLSQKKCKAQRSMWMRYEGHTLGMLFVPWPGSFPAAVHFCFQKFMWSLSLSCACIPALAFLPGKGGQLLPLHHCAHFHAQFYSVVPICPS